MPNIKSAEKRVLVSDKKRLQNRIINSEMKTAVKKFNAAISAQNVEEAERLLPLASKQIMINDYNQSPPPDIVWPADEQPCYTFTEATVKNLNKDGAKVALQANIDFANYHYQTSCVVKWDSTLQATKVSNAKIFEVPKADQ